MSKKGQRHKNLTATFLSGKLDEDRLDSQQRFTQRNKHHQRNKTARTTLLRAAESAESGNIDVLPLGRVIQVHSIFFDVESEGQLHQCVARKTAARTNDTRAVVGDQVRFTAISGNEGVIERIDRRSTILTRADIRNERDRSVGQIPIVANADQMLIVVSVALPRPKWGLVDRMIVAARSGGLVPIVCLNKADLLTSDDPRISPNQLAQVRVEAVDVLSHYQRLRIDVLQTSAEHDVGTTQLKAWLRDRMTVLAGHSGVGKSSLIRIVQPGLDIRVGEISNYNQKGRHTTTSARLYPLEIGGSVVDTPGVKLFGIVNVSRDMLIDFFPDVADGSAPEWRRDSYERLAQSLDE